MGWPQYTMLALLFMSTGIYAAKDGQPKTGTYSFVGALVSDAVMIGLLYAGGFFS